MTRSDPAAPSATAGHEVVALGQLTAKKGGQGGLHVLADESNNLNSSSHKGSLQSLRDGAAKKHFRPETRNFLRSAKEFAAGQDRILPSDLAPILNVDQVESVRDIEHGG